MYKCMENSDKFVSNLKNLMLRYSWRTNVWFKVRELQFSKNTYDNILYLVRQEWKAAPHRGDEKNQY